MGVLELSNISKSYKSGQVQVNALKDINLSIEKGDFASIMGPSGSGKSTLLNIIGCLDLPTVGTYKIGEEYVQKLKDGQLSDIRNQLIGFVFQRFHLLPNLNALENVELPLIYQGLLGKERKERSMKALESVGLVERVKHFPSQLSGGEQQRVAIARAIVTNPTILLADEPTGALDSRSSENIMHIFQQLNKEMGITIVQVTHEYKVAQHGEKIYHLLDGELERIETVNVQKAI